MPPHGHHRFGDVLGHPHRPAALLRQRHRQRFDLGPGLAAVGAAHVGNDDPDARQRKAEDVGQLELDAEGVGRGTPDRQAVGVDLGNGHVGLHGVVVHHGEREGVFHHRVGLGEPGRDVALLEPVAEADVARGRLVEQRRAVGSGLLDGDHRGQGLVLHRHRTKRIFGRVLGIRRYRGHRLTGKQRAVQRDDGMILYPAAEVRVPVAKVLPGEDGADPGNPLRRAGVDGDDARVRVGAPQDLATEHAGDGHVRNVLRLPRDLGHPVHPASSGADDLHGRWSRGGNRRFVARAGLKPAPTRTTRKQKRFGGPRRFPRCLIAALERRRTRTPSGLRRRPPRPSSASSPLPQTAHSRRCRRAG